MPPIHSTPTVPLSPYQKKHLGKAFSPTPSDYTPDLYKALDGDGDQPQRLIPVPDVRQPNDFSCGAACAMSVGRFYGVGPEHISDWEDALGTNRGTSTHPLAIRDYLISLGLQVEAKDNLTLEDLHRYWEQGIPVICPMKEWGNPLKDEKHKDRGHAGQPAEYDYGHFVIYIGGPALGYVFVQDPSVSNVINQSDTGTDDLPDDLVARAVEFLEGLGYNPGE